MGFKFDEDDDELSLDVGGDTAKTQRPAPLPPQPKKQEEDEAPRASIPTKPAKVEPTSDVLKNLPQPGQSVSNPAQDDSGLSSLLEPQLPQQPPVVQQPPAQPVYQEPIQQQVYTEPVYETYDEDEEYEEQQSTLNVAPVPVSNKSRRYDANNEQPVEELASRNVLTEEESKTTLFKSKGTPFSGARKKVIRIRVIFGLVVGFLIFAGIFSFLPKPGFTSDITAQSLAVTNGNKYDSIRQAAESHALKLMTNLLHRPNYDFEKSLADRLDGYVNSEQIVQLLSAFELPGYEIETFEERTYGRYYQTIVTGPFVENQEVITTERITRLDTDNNGTNESYIYTIRISAFVSYSTDKAEAKAAVTKPVQPMPPKWVYYIVPVVYNSETKTVHLYDMPTITNAPAVDDYTIYKELGKEDPFESEDKDLGNNSQFRTAVRGFFAEWALQGPVTNVTNVRDVLKNMLSLNVITDKTSPLYPKYRIARGLGGAYRLNDVEGAEPIKLTVEAVPEDQIEDLTETTPRRMIVRVEWIDNNIPGGESYIRPVIVQEYVVTFMGTTRWYFIDIRAKYTE